MWRPLLGESGEGGGKVKMRCYWRLGDGGLASVLDAQSLFFLLKKIEFAPWPDIMLIIHYNKLLARNLPFDFDVRQWTYSLMIPLHCCGLNRKKNAWSFWIWRALVFLLLFWFNFVHSHARCGCCSIFYLCFQVMQIKQAYCKMSTKKKFF